MKKRETERFLEEVIKDANKYMDRIVKSINEYKGTEAIGIVLAMRIISKTIMEEEGIPEAVMAELENVSEFDIEVAEKK